MKGIADKLHHLEQFAEALNFYRTFDNNKLCTESSTYTVLSQYTSVLQRYWINKGIIFFHCSSASDFVASFAQQKLTSNATENRRCRRSPQRYLKKDKLHQRHLLPEILLRFKATTFVFLEIFFWIFLKRNFPNTLNGFVPEKCAFG